MSVEDPGSGEKLQYGSWKCGCRTLTVRHVTIAALYVIGQVHSPTATISMAQIQIDLDLVVAKLSDQNYAQSLAFYRFWFDIGHTYHQIPSDWIFDAIRSNKETNSMLNPRNGKLIHSNARLILRFASDVESDHLLAPHTHGLQSRLCAKSLQEFFDDNMGTARGAEGDPSVLPGNNFYTEVNLIAHWANLGYVEEAAIRTHILQSLISHQKLYDHQADALVILFKLAGATFEAYADPSVVDRCFDLLKNHKYYNQYGDGYSRRAGGYAQARGEPLQVRATRAVKSSHQAKTTFRR